MGTGSKENRTPPRGLGACSLSGRCARLPLGRQCPRARPGLGSGHSAATHTHPALATSPCSGLTHHLHGCSLTWFEPVSATGFASVELSWFCFAVVIVFNSNAARHKEVVTSFLSQHQGWLPKAPSVLHQPGSQLQKLPSCPPHSLSFLDRPLSHGSPK